MWLFDAKWKEDSFKVYCNLELKEKLSQSSSIRLLISETWWQSRSDVSKLWNLYDLFSKERIEKRGPIAKDVTLDVQVFKPTLAKSLLDEIT